jgi:hypothetical protein
MASRVSVLETRRRRGYQTKRTAMYGVRVLRGAAGVAAVGVLGVVVTATSVRLQSLAPDSSGTAEVVYLPDAHLLRPLVLGYDNVLANVLWFRTISYFGGHYESDRKYPWLARMCDLVTDLDPRAEHVYRFAGLILPWEANDVDGGIRLLEKGVRNLPESWLLHYYLGMTHYFFRNDADAAAEYLATAARLPGAPPLVTRVAALMYGRRANPGTTVQFLRELLKNADSDQMREVLTRSLEDAEFRATAAALQPVVDAYRKQVGSIPPSMHAIFERGILRGELPKDPYGGHWEVDQSTGQLRSSTGRVPRELHESAAVQARRRQPSPVPADR